MAVAAVDDFFVDTVLTPSLFDTFRRFMTVVVGFLRRGDGDVVLLPEEDVDGCGGDDGDSSTNRLMTPLTNLLISRRIIVWCAWSGLKSMWF